MLPRRPNPIWFTPDFINSNYPVAALTYYKNGLEVHRLTFKKSNAPPGRKERPIVELSRKSLCRLAFVAQNTDVEFRSLMTLTYPCAYPSDGKQVKKDLNKFLVYAKRRFGNFSYLWFLEFQKRGAPHIHVLTTLYVVGRPKREQFADVWARICTATAAEYRTVRYVHERLEAWEEIRDKDGAVKYATSYALKPYQKQVPKEYQNVGRFWGTSRDVTPEPISRTVPASEETVRALLKNTNHQTKNYDVIPKFIFGIREEL